MHALSRHHSLKAMNRLRFRVSSSSSSLFPQIRRCLSSTPTSAGPMGKGHDLLEAVNSDGSLITQVMGFGKNTFRVNNLILNHSIICLPSNVLVWNNVISFDDLNNIKNLEIFPILYPTIEVLMIGCGDRMPRQINLDVRKFFASKGIVVETTDTLNAASTFNLLALEGRNVAAALIPLSK